MVVEHVEGHRPTAGGPGPRGGPRQRALAIWPRLDRRALSRCGDDPRRIARLVARRTNLPPEVIWTVLIEVETPDAELWFG